MQNVPLLLLACMSQHRSPNTAAREKESQCSRLKGLETYKKKYLRPPLPKPVTFSVEISGAQVIIENIAELVN
jgi:hypothetical protein